MEGMQGFGRRHFGSLPRATTEFVCIECVGSPQLCVVEAEGMLRMRPYTESSRDALRAGWGRRPRPAAPRPAHGGCDGRPDRAAGGLSDLHAGRRRRERCSVQLPLAFGHAREPELGGRRGSRARVRGVRAVPGLAGRLRDRPRPAATSAPGRGDGRRRRRRAARRWCPKIVIFPLLVGALAAGDEAGAGGSWRSGIEPVPASLGAFIDPSEAFTTLTSVTSPPPSSPPLAFPATSAIANAAASATQTPATRISAHLQLAGAAGRACPT